MKHLFTALLSNGKVKIAQFALYSKVGDLYIVGKIVEAAIGRDTRSEDPIAPRIYDKFDYVLDEPSPFFGLAAGETIRLHCEGAKQNGQLKVYQIEEPQLEHWFTVNYKDGESDPGPLTIGQFEHFIAWRNTQTKKHTGVQIEQMDDPILGTWTATRLGSKYITVSFFRPVNREGALEERVAELERRLNDA